MYYEIILSGLPGYPKTAVAVEGRDATTGEMWRSDIDPDPENPTQSLPIRVPTDVHHIRVIAADELVEEFVRAQAAAVGKR